MEELWLKDNELIPKFEWIQEINKLKTNIILNNKEEIKKQLKKQLISAVEKRLPNKKFAILFSGGVDSSFIAAVCKKLNKDFVCISIGFQDDTKEPEDIVEAKKVAKKLNLNLKYKVFNLVEAENIIEETVGILKTYNKTDVVNIGVGSVVLAAIALGRKEGINYFLGGLGSEEIFAGYERHDKAQDINDECWKGLEGMWERDLIRDFNLAKKLGVKVKTPFLDEELINFAMKIPSEWKIVKEQKKVILREVAEELLGEFAWRKKKAAQYGSCFDKAIAKLTKKKGFEFKKDYLESLR
ncbi:MAG: asparagine synthase-related protein [Candidatus Woesearchaeota archaeon]